MPWCVQLTDRDSLLSPERSWRNQKRLGKSWAFLSPLMTSPKQGNGIELRWCSTSWQLPCAASSSPPRESHPVHSPVGLRLGEWAPTGFVGSSGVRRWRSSRISCSGRRSSRPSESPLWSTHRAGPSPRPRKGRCSRRGRQWTRRLPVERRRRRLFSRSIHAPRHFENNLRRNDESLPRQGCGTLHKTRTHRLLVAFDDPWTDHSRIGPLDGVRQVRPAR